MEALTLVSAPLVIALMASIHETASRDRRVFGLMAPVFAAVMAGLTSAVHFVALTSGRQTDFGALEWPSALYAVELLTWDFFLGLSLLSAPLFSLVPASGLWPDGLSLLRVPGR